MWLGYCVCHLLFCTANGHNPGVTDYQGMRGCSEALGLHVVGHRASPATADVCFLCRSCLEMRWSFVGHPNVALPQNAFLPSPTLWHHAWPAGQASSNNRTARMR